MNLAETHDLLTLIAVYDNRRFDDATVIAWQPIFAEFPLADCQAAVVRHFATSDVYLMPVHVLRLAEEVDRDRRRIGRERAEASAAAAIEADPTRRDRSDDVRELIAQMRAMLPDGDPDKLRWGHRHWRQAREQRERLESAQPNPHYDPAAVARLAALDAALAQQGTNPEGETA